MGRGEGRGRDGRGGDRGGGEWKEKRFGRVEEGRAPHTWSISVSLASTVKKVGRSCGSLSQQALARLAYGRGTPIGKTGRAFFLYTCMQQTAPGQGRGGPGTLGWKGEGRGGGDGLKACEGGGGDGLEDCERGWLLVESIMGSVNPPPIIGRLQHMSHVTGQARSQAQAQVTC